MGLKPCDFLGNILEPTELRAVLFIQASIHLWDNVIMRVCASTVCFGWIIVHWVLTAPQHCTWPANFSWKFLPYQFWSDWKSHKNVWNSVSWHIGSGLWEAGVPKLHQCFVSSSLPERAFGITDSMAQIKSALNCSHLHLSHNSLIQSRHRVLPDLSSSLSIWSEVLFLSVLLQEGYWIFQTTFLQRSV